MYFYLSRKNVSIFLYPLCLNIDILTEQMYGSKLNKGKLKVNSKR